MKKNPTFFYTRKKPKRQNEWLTACSVPHHHQPYQAEPNHNNLYTPSFTTHAHKGTFPHRSALLQPRSNLASP